MNPRRSCVPRNVRRITRTVHVCFAYNIQTLKHCVMIFSARPCTIACLETDLFLFSLRTCFWFSLFFFPFLLCLCPCCLIFLFFYSFPQCFLDYFQNFRVFSRSALFAEIVLTDWSAQVVVHKCLGSVFLLKISGRREIGFSASSFNSIGTDASCVICLKLAHLLLTGCWNLYPLV